MKFYTINNNNFGISKKYFRQALRLEIKIIIASQIALRKSFIITGVPIYNIPIYDID